MKSWQLFILLPLLGFAETPEATITKVTFKPAKAHTGSGWGPLLSGKISESATPNGPAIGVEFAYKGTGRGYVPEIHFRLVTENAKGERRFLDGATKAGPESYLPKIATWHNAAWSFAPKLYRGPQRSKFSNEPSYKRAIEEYKAKTVSKVVAAHVELYDVESKTVIKESKWPTLEKRAALDLPADWDSRPIVVHIDRVFEVSNEPAK